MELAYLPKHTGPFRRVTVYVKKGVITVVLFTILPLVMSGRGHRKLQLCSRKNYERKKLKKPSTPLSTCSSLTVSIPFELLPAQPLTVSLPISLFHDTPFSTFESRVECAGFIPRGTCTLLCMYMCSCTCICHVMFICTHVVF